MADDVDIASELIETSLQIRLQQISKQKIPENTSGECIYCGEPVPDTRRWCTASCRDLDLRRK